MIDIGAMAELAHKAKALAVVDNTFASPYLQQPLLFGADLVTHSTTKYLGGHSDVVGGAVVGNSADLHERLKFIQNAAGGVPGPFDSWLVLRGAKTLAVRMERHSANAQAIAEWLAENPKVASVNYLGFLATEDPRYPVFRRQCQSAGSTFGFAVKGGEAEAFRLLDALQVIKLAVSLGGTETLMSHPASTTHSGVPKQTRDRIGITDALIRISVGIEDAGDLIADLGAALDAI